jgi:hypothetical protein
MQPQLRSHCGFDNIKKLLSRSLDPNFGPLFKTMLFTRYSVLSMFKVFNLWIFASFAVVRQNSIQGDIVEASWIVQEEFRNLH